MNDQKDIDLINQKLYSLDVPSEPIKKLMFYFTVLHDVIDYPFPANYLNFNNPYFKTYSEMQKFFALAVALKPENLHVANVIIFYNNKNYYKPDQQNCNYEFRVINPKEASDAKFDKNYQNTYNINNINSNEKQFDIKINENIEYPHSEDSSSTPEDYYYGEGLEDNYLPDDNNNNPYNSSFISNPNKYQDFRKKYNEQIAKKNERKISRSSLYKNQKSSNVENEEEEDEEEINGNVNEVVTVNVNIVNKLVVSKNWIDYIYNDSMKKNLVNMKHIMADEDEIMHFFTKKHIFLHDNWSSNCSSFMCICNIKFSNST